MKTRNIALVLTAIAAVSSQAQIKETWSLFNYDANFAATPQDTAVSPDGSTYVVSRILAPNQLPRLRLTKYNGLGTIVWSVAMPEKTEDSYPNRIAVDSQGQVLLAYNYYSQNSLLDYKVSKIDAGTGSVLWSSAVNGPSYDQFTDLEIDAQDNVVMLGSKYVGQETRATLRKMTPAGAMMFEHVDNSPFATSGYDLAVAGNGLIYYTGSWSKGSLAYQITPNGTAKYLGFWENYKVMPGFTMVAPASITANRNGRALVSEESVTKNGVLNMRMVGPDGNLQFMEEVTLGQYIAYGTRPVFDGNGKVVVTNGAPRSNNGYAMEVFWLTPGSSSFTSRVSTVVEPAAAGNQVVPTRLYTDVFGQAYVSGLEQGTAKQARCWAFDENVAGPLWFRSELIGQQATYSVPGAVGRWGQVAFVSTIDPNYNVESANGIKQLGLRNVTINGNAFTGGRTITGTVNFYSSTTTNRNVALLSNTPYAKIAQSVDLASGATQAAISIELKPTSIRRAVRIEATHNGLVRSAVFYVDPPAPAFLNVFPTTVKGGLQVNASTRLNGIAPTGGMTVNLMSNNAAATMPSSVMVAENTDLKSFKVNTSTVAAPTVVTLSASASSVTKTATLTVTP